MRNSLFQFEDIALLMTIFVLFGDDIKLLSAPSSDGRASFFHSCLPHKPTA
jgi:hypothetical protein